MSSVDHLSPVIDVSSDSIFEGQLLKVSGQSDQFIKVINSNATITESNFSNLDLYQSVPFFISV